MHFTPAVAATILALASSAAAVPFSPRAEQTPAPAPAPALTLTQQLFLAET